MNGSVSAEMAYAYDPLGRLKTYEKLARVSEKDITYDRAGNITTLTR